MFQEPQVFQERASHRTRWRLPMGVYNPVVAADGRRWLDYEFAAEELAVEELGAQEPAAQDESTPVFDGGVFDRGLPPNQVPVPDSVPYPAPWQWSEGQLPAQAQVPTPVPAGGVGLGTGHSYGLSTGLGTGPGMGPGTGPGTGLGGVDSAWDGDRGRAVAVGGDGYRGGDGLSPGEELVGGTGLRSSSGFHSGDGLRLGVDWFDRSCRPPRLDQTRPYGRPGGLAKPDPHTQEDLARAVRGRFPDPRGTWIRLINAGGASEDPFRSSNAIDCALALLSTWHGEPMVSAPARPEYDRVGKPVLSGEFGGVARAEQWLGHRFECAGLGRRAYVSIAHRLIVGGHGSAAMLITRWPTGGSHAWNAVNWRGELLWIDAQRGHMAVEPPYEDVTGVFCVIIDHEGRRL